MIDKENATLIIADTFDVALGYAPWIEEVIANYLSNAIKYGGNPPVIEMGSTPLEDDMVQFWVRDNGAGLDEEQQARLFAKFTRLNNVRVSGYGLGLSIVKRIMDKLGGRFDVQSAPNEGSTFSFILPAAPVD
jgi:signal transduction histidine kinase